MMSRPKIRRMGDAPNSGRRAPDLPRSYELWRQSKLGRITDALETAVILDLIGPAGGWRMLDVGCGDGAMAATLAGGGATVVGLDADRRMLAAATRRAGALNLDFVCGRAEMLPFGNAIFDRVIAMTVLCFVDDPDRAVAEAARALRSRGRLVIGELGRWSLWSAIRRIRGYFGASLWQAARFRTVGELRTLLESHGLRVVESRGAVFYPPSATAARLMSPVDSWLGRQTTIGASFIVISAVKP